MKKLIKLCVLIIISLSVYFIYQENKRAVIRILNIGDSLALGINSYGVRDYGYIDYYKDYLEKDNTKVEIVNTYSAKEQSLSNILQEVKNNPKIKRDLIDSHLLILSLGYNDLIYKISIEENMSSEKSNRIISQINSDYEELIKEIRKYYKNEIIVIGYYKSNRDDYYINYGIKQFNEYMKKYDDIKYVDTYKLLSNKKKYFSNPNSYYPNSLGYEQISDKIIKKTLEN